MDVDQLPLHDLDILGFGEAMHGPDEFLTKRNDLFKHLVNHHGFTTLAIESSFPHSRLVNDYVQNDGAAAWANGLSHDQGQLQYNREIIDWMRNQNKERETKLQFYGFDIAGLTAAPASPRHTLSHFHDASILGNDKQWENPAPEMVEEVKAVVQDAASQLQDPEKLHYAHITLQHLDFFLALGRGWSGSLQIRDEMMADNLTYILGQSPGKVLAFAHNIHLQRGEASMQVGAELCTWMSAGTYLGRKHRYAVIGTGVQEDAEEGTYEALYPGWHKASNRENLKRRSDIPTNPTYQPLNPQALTNFDWIEVLKCVS